MSSLQEAKQEKYGLHLKLENFEIEYDNTIKELQYDISQLRQELESKTNQNSAGEKEKILKIRELTQQVCLTDLGTYRCMLYAASK